MSCILSQLNILCNNLIKPYFTKMTTHPLFTVHMLRPFQAFSNVMDLLRVSNPYITTFSTLSGVRTMSLILLQLAILCTSAVKR